MTNVQDVESIHVNVRINVLYVGIDPALALRNVQDVVKNLVNVLPHQTLQMYNMTHLVMSMRVLQATAFKV